MIGDSHYRIGGDRLASGTGSVGDIKAILRHRPLPQRT
jgi:hypothetical protein